MKGNIYEFPLEEIIADAKGDSMCVFDNPQDLTAFLRDLKEADPGLSVVVSGLFEIVDECFVKAGLKHHTANFSLGVWGDTGKLPDNDVLGITTMCGHGMIPPNLIRAMVKEVRERRRTAEEAAKLLASNCSCGVFNPARTAKLLTVMANN